MFLRVSANLLRLPWLRALKPYWLMDQTEISNKDARSCYWLLHPKGSTFAPSSRGVTSFGGTANSKPCWCVLRHKRWNGRGVVGVPLMTKGTGDVGPDNWLASRLSAKVSRPLRVPLQRCPPKSKRNGRKNYCLPAVCYAGEHCRREEMRKLKASLPRSKLVLTKVRTKRGPQQPVAMRQLAYGSKRFAGVRFPSLSVAWASGSRPEHLCEALMAKRRSVTNRLLRAVADLSQAGGAGKLPTSARWLLDSRLVFLRKPGSDTPRPIRVGEFWRRVIAKRLAHDQRDKWLRLLLSHRHCGVGLPGGANALVHLRRCLELAAHDIDEAVVVLDLDLRNAFPSLEWPAVRAAVRDLAPEASAWIHWCQGEAVHVQLPCGKWMRCDRGAEQGDPLGPAYCALTLIRCAQAGRAAVEAVGGWVWDAWYMDDGQVVLPPQHAAAYVSFGI